jgi:hypothetical protein
MHKLDEKLRFGRLCLPDDTWQIIEAESWETRVTDRDTDDVGTEFATMMVAKLDKRRSKKLLVVYHRTNRRQLRTSDYFLEVVGIVGFGKQDSARLGDLGPSWEASLRASPILAIVYETTTESYSSAPLSTCDFGRLEFDVQRATGAGVRGPRRLDTRDGLDDGRLSGGLFAFKLVSGELKHIKLCDLPRTMHLGKGIFIRWRPRPSKRLMVAIASLTWSPRGSISLVTGAACC